MCRAATCKTCGKTTWAVCGQHIDSVRKGVPARDWCGGSHSQAEIDAAGGARKGFFTRLFGR